jgi:hypothetical protein
MATFGSITNPLATVGGGAGYGSVEASLPLFLSNIIRLITIAGGIYALFNIIFAGFTYITAGGDTKKLESAVSSINMSVLGLVVMVASIAISAVLGWILFGNPGAIINPTIYGPGAFN